MILLNTFSWSTINIRLHATTVHELENRKIGGKIIIASVFFDILSYTIGNINFVFL